MSELELNHYQYFRFSTHPPAGLSHLSDSSSYLPDTLGGGFG
jgi:hypothetical protein